jgi:hypothetical protein
MSTTTGIESTKQSRRKQDKIKKEESGKLLWTWSNPLMIKQANSLGWSITPSMVDLQLSNVINRSSRIEKEIKVLVRRKVIDRLGIVDDNKKARIEVVYAQVSMTGFDDRDHKVAFAHIDEFKDGLYQTNAVYEDEDNVEYKKGVFNDVYTKAWKGPETFDEIVNREGYDINLDTCQFSIDGGNGSYGGMSAEEFKNLSFEELETRGQIGFINQPIDYKITELPTEQRLKMFQEARAKRQ